MKNLLYLLLLMQSLLNCMEEQSNKKARLDITNQSTAEIPALNYLAAKTVASIVTQNEQLALYKNTKAICNTNLIDIADDVQDQIFQKMPNLLRIFEHESSIRWAAFSPNGNFILAPEDSCAVVKLWDVKTGECAVLDLEYEKCIAALFNHDGTKILLIKKCGSTDLWDVASKAQLHEFDVDEDFFAINDSSKACFSHNGELIITTGKTYCIPNRIKIYDAATYKCLYKLYNATRVISLVLSPDDKYLITVSSDSVKLWSLESFGSLGILCLFTFAHDKYMRAATFSPDGKLIATKSQVSAKIWDAKTGLCLRAFESNSSYFVAFSPDSKTIVTVSKKYANIWDIASGNCLQALGENEGIHSAQFSPDSKRILTRSNSDCQAKLWDVATGSCLQAFDHDGSITSAKFSPNGTLIITTSADKSAKLWMVATTLQEKLDTLANYKLIESTSSDNL